MRGSHLKQKKPSKRTMGFLASCFAMAYFIFSAFACNVRRIDLHGYPTQIRSLYLHNFTNNTFQGDVNWELTDQLRQEMHFRENFRITNVKDEAALQLHGEITLFRKSGRLYNNYRQPVRYEIFVACRVRLLRNPQQGGGVIYSAERSASVEYSESEGYAESETAARQRLLERLAINIHDALETGFVASLQEPES